MDIFGWVSFESFAICVALFVDLTHFCPSFQHLLSERLMSVGIMGASGAPLKPLRDDSALRALSSLRGLRGAPDAPIMPRDVSLSESKCWNGGQKLVNVGIAAVLQ